MIAWCFFGASLVVSLTLLLLLTKTSLGKFALDTPNNRSLHTKVTPRTGGVAIVGALMLTWVFVDGLVVWLLPVGLLATISMVDDVVDMSVLWRFLVQLLVAGCFVIYFINLSWLASLLCVVALVWMTNLYNFMDGSDGLAGGMAVFGFGAYTIAAVLGHGHSMTLMCICIVGASLAFLSFNFHPAKIFMGDSGSIPLGFLAGAVGLFGWNQSLWAWWFPILVFSPFIVDASVTLLKRGLNGEKVWQAHKSHYYQRLVQLGLGHRNVALIEYLLMLLCGLTAVYLLNQSKMAISYTLIGWSIFYLVLITSVDHIWAKHTKSD